MYSTNKCYKFVPLNADFKEFFLTDSFCFVDNAAQFNTLQKIGMEFGLTNYLGGTALLCYKREWKDDDDDCAKNLTFFYAGYYQESAFWVRDASYGPPMHYDQMISCYVQCSRSELAKRIVLDAIVAGIEHWKRLQNGSQPLIEHGVMHCSLCDLYRHESMSMLTQCTKCPLTTLGMACEEYGSPWMLAHEVWRFTQGGGHVPGRGETADGMIRKATGDMIDTLTRAFYHVEKNGHRERGL